ncbi:diiron oxygenase [Agaribacterium haliotis]|uniref:diiron oxygenase n=1 Tax=Agaribacterium haliotis TaxID=2013869 RepID=UPI000BB538ED|nr:diiron oxygenase [Agaribacterium haliotis]
MTNTLDLITEKAHINTVHPNALNWPEKISHEELNHMSRLTFEDELHPREAMVYVTKELAQLAEIEKHVTGVMSIVLSELQGDAVQSLNDGHSLHHALSCFAAEELHHANMFYRYVRLLSGCDFKYADNLYAQRVALYQGDDSPWIKLAALCCSAYIGESVITVFEHRCTALDPERKFFITQLLEAHGLDEARHIQIDHYVFDEVIPRFNEAELRRMKQIVNATEELNTELSMRFGKHAAETFSCDFAAGNKAMQTQIELTLLFRELVFGGEGIQKVDAALDEVQQKLVENFSYQQHIHTQKLAG